MKKIHVLYTSDMHGFWINRLDDADHSLLNTANAIKQLKNEYESNGEEVLLIDLGDFIQGADFTTYLNQIKENGSVLAKAMNYIEYDYQVIGNHEFNYGLPYLTSILDELNAEILSNNILTKETEESMFGEPFSIIELQGIKIGIIGTTTHYIPNWEMPANYEGLVFKDAFSMTKQTVELIRSKVDIVIVAYHGGFERDLSTGQPLEALTGENQGYQMLSEIEGIDCLITGHQHRLINEQFNYSIAMQPGYAGRSIGHIIFEIEEGRLVSMSSELIDANNYPKDETLMHLMEPEITEANEWLNQILGVAPLKISSDDIFMARVQGTPFIEMINQIQLRVTGADFSATTLINEHYKNFTGEITQQNLLHAYPYHNLIAKVRITGQELYDIMTFNLEYLTLDHSGKLVINPDYIHPKPKHYNWDMYTGLRAIVDMHLPKKDRVIALVDERTNQPIDPEQEYTLAISQYRAVGGGDYHWFNESKIVEMTDKDIASLIPEALNQFTMEDWRYINTNYSHIKWI